MTLDILFKVLDIFKDLCEKANLDMDEIYDEYVYETEQQEKFKKASFEEMRTLLSEFDYFKNTKEDTIDFLKYMLHEIDKLEN